MASRISVLVILALTLLSIPRAGAEQAHRFGAKLQRFNVEKPPTHADLKGRVVVLDFWTLG